MIVTQATGRLCECSGDAVRGTTVDMGSTHGSLPLSCKRNVNGNKVDKAEGE